MIQNTQVRWRRSLRNSTALGFSVLSSSAGRLALTKATPERLRFSHTNRFKGSSSGMAFASVKSARTSERKTVSSSLSHAERLKMERMLKWFEYGHLPEHLQQVSRTFSDLAHYLCESIEPGPERTVALRKLLEAKDAAVRAKLNPGG